MAARRWVTASVLCALASASATFAPLSAGAAQQATQLVRFEVRAVNELAVSGSPSLVVNSAVAGSGPVSAAHSGSSYAVSTNESNQKIIASLDADLPPGLTLEVSLAAPSGAASKGTVPLSSSAAEVVTGISTTAATSLPITYRLNASAQASVTTQSRTVTFTIVSGA